MRPLLMFICVFLLQSNLFGQTTANEYLKTLKEDTSTFNLKVENDDYFWHSYSAQTQKSLLQFSVIVAKGVFKAQKAMSEKSFDTIRPYILLVDPVDFLKEPLVFNGVEVEKETHKMANGRIGIATCRDNKVKIVLPTRVDERLSLEGLIFFMEHELAHIRLGHASCSAVSNSNSKLEREKMADSEAVKSILSRKGGESIILQTLGLLFALNEPSSNSHPSSKDRRKFILDEFGKFRDK